MQQAMQTYAIVGAAKMRVNSALRRAGEFAGFAIM
jgi:hypothetical protein